MRPSGQASFALKQVFENAGAGTNAWPRSFNYELITLAGPTNSAQRLWRGSRAGGSDTLAIHPAAPEAASLTSLSSPPPLQGTALPMLGMVKIACDHNEAIITGEYFVALGFLPVTVRSFHVSLLHESCTEKHFAELTRLQCTRLEELSLWRYHGSADERAPWSVAIARVIGDALARLGSLRMIALNNVPLPERFFTSLVGAKRAQIEKLDGRNYQPRRTPDIAIPVDANDWIVTYSGENSECMELEDNMPEEFFFIRGTFGEVLRARYVEGLLLDDLAAVDGLCSPACKDIKFFHLEDVWLSRFFERGLRQRWRDLPLAVRRYFANRLKIAGYMREITIDASRTQQSPDDLPDDFR